MSFEVGKKRVEPVEYVIFLLPILLYIYSINDLRYQIQPRPETSLVPFHRTLSTASTSPSTASPPHSASSLPTSLTSSTTPPSSSSTSPPLASTPTLPSTSFLSFNRSAKIKKTITRFEEKKKKSIKGV